MATIKDILLLIFMVLGGGVIELGLQKAYFKLTGQDFKEYHFSIGKYLYLMIPVLIAILFFVNKFGHKLLVVIFTFAFIGTFFEWAIGLFYHQIVGQRLWSYHRCSIGRYTSLLSIPIWGLAGILFWLLAQVFL